MKFNCDMIRDLLPLYQDDVCSESSRLIVEEHLRECRACSDFLEELRSSGDIENVIDLEREDALSSQAKFFKRKSAVIGTVFAGIFMLPVVICLIVGLATGGFSWVMIVLAAMFIPASLIAVPLLASENKALWTLSSFSVSLILLLGVCNVLGGGGWFFTAASSALFGLSMFFAPFAVKAKPIASKIKSRKGLSVITLDTILFVVMMLCIGFEQGLGAGYYKLAGAISLPILLWAWALFLCIRYLRVGKALRTAAALGITGVIMMVCNFVFGMSDMSSVFYIEAFGTRAEFSSFPATAVICLIIGAVFALIGVLTGKKRRK